MVRQHEPEVICRGAEILSHSESTEAIEALLPLLRSRSELVQDCVSEALNQMDVAPLLLDWWRGGDDEKRALALGHAAALSHPALLELLREATEAKDADLRKYAAIGLKRQRPGTEVLSLLESLASDPDEDVRWWAIDSLGLLDVPAAKAILEKIKRALESQ